MSKCLVSVDWDYLSTQKRSIGVLILKTKRSLVDLWYKRYLMEKSKGRDIKRVLQAFPRLEDILGQYKKRFSFAEDVSAFVSIRMLCRMT